MRNFFAYFKPTAKNPNVALGAFLAAMIGAFVLITAMPPIIYLGKNLLGPWWSYWLR